MLSMVDNTSRVCNLMMEKKTQDCYATMVDSTSRNGRKHKTDMLSAVDST